MKIFNPGTVHFTYSGFYPKNTLYPSTTLYPQIPDLTLGSTQGDVVVEPLECIEKRSNNEWYLDVELMLTNLNYIVQDAICLVNTKEKGEQPFRIRNIEVGNTVRFEAWHVGYDTEKYFIEYSTAVSTTCQQAMIELLSNSVPYTTPFTLSSDVSGTNTVTIENMTLYNAFVKLADEYNGYLDFDGFEVQIVSSQGADNGVTLEYGKNIEQASIDENWDLVVTRLYPLGNDEIKLPEKWLVADVQYDRPYAKQMAFDTDSVENLRLVAQLYLDRFKVPRVNYKVKANVTGNVDLGDTILVKARQFEVFTEVIAYEFNVNTQRLVNVEFGNYQKTVRKAVQEYVENATQKALDEIILRGLVRFENLTDGVTIIDGSNIQTGSINADLITTGKITAVDIEGVTIIGTTITGGTINGTTITTSEDMNVGTRIKMERIIVSDILGLAQETLGKNGISWGISNPPSTYPYAFITAFDIGQLSGQNDVWQMLLKTNKAIDIDTPEINMKFGSTIYRITRDSNGFLKAN